MRMVFCGFVLATLLTTLQQSIAADAHHGAELARRWCAACHIVAPDQTNGSTQAPPFSAIANRPGFDVNRLAYFLLNPHPKMPDMGLSRIDAGDLAAYIAQQR